jgi:hypothetical protein
MKIGWTDGSVTRIDSVFQSMRILPNTEEDVTGGQARLRSGIHKSLIAQTHLSVDAMTTDYIQAALACAEYEVIEGIAPLYGEVPGLQGAWATAPSIEFCRENLEEVIADWIIFRVARRLSIPSLEELDDRFPPGRRPVDLTEADGPVQWPELIRKIRGAGFNGPFWRGIQPFVIRGTVTVRLPVPERAHVDLDLLSRILGHAGITREEWASL